MIVFCFNFQFFSSFIISILSWNQKYKKKQKQNKNRFVCCIFLQLDHFQNGQKVRPGLIPSGVNPDVIHLIIQYEIYMHTTPLIPGIALK